MKKILTIIIAFIMILGISTVFVSAEKIDNESFSIEIPEGFEKYSSSDLKQYFVDKTYNQYMWFKVKGNNISVVQLQTVENSSKYNIAKISKNEIKELENDLNNKFKSENFKNYTYDTKIEKVNGYDCLHMQYENLKTDNSDDVVLSADVYLFTSVDHLYCLIVMSDNMSAFDGDIDTIIESFKIKGKLFVSNSKRNSLYLVGIVIATILLIVFFIVNKNSNNKKIDDTAYFDNYNNLNNPYGANTYNSANNNMGSYNQNTYNNAETYNSNTYSNSGYYNSNTYNNYGSYNSNSYNNFGSYNSNTYSNSNEYSSGVYNSSVNNSNNNTSEMDSISLNNNAYMDSISVDSYNNNLTNSPNTSLNNNSYMDSTSSNSYNSHSTNSQDSLSNNTSSNGKSDWLSSGNSSEVDVNKLADELWND